MKKTILLLTAVALLSGAAKYALANQKSHNHSDEELYYSDGASGDSSSDEGLFIHTNFVTHYFSNLENNFGYNRKGSCGYIGLEMLLSFYDSYWSDNIVPESYDSDPQSFDETILDCTNSPGTFDEYTNNYSIVQENSYISDYLQYIYDYKDVSLHLNLVNIGVNILEHMGFFSPFGSNADIIKETSDFYFRRMNVWDEGKYGTSPNQPILLNSRVKKVSDFYGTEEQREQQLREFVLEKIRRGVPIEIFGTKNNPETNGDSRHAFVAYDYDQDEDEIYVHTGYHERDTHMPLSEFGYSIDQILYLEPNCNHVDSHNYYRASNPTLKPCPCSLLIPHDIEQMSPELYLDYPAVFRWNLDFFELSYMHLLNWKYDVSFLDRYNVEKFRIQNVNDNWLTVSAYDFSTIMNSIEGSTFKLYITISSNNALMDDYYTVRTFNKPTQFHNKVQVLPSDWYFPERYYFENEGIKNSTIIKDNLGITTSRLRCGYIQQSYIVLSPRRAGAGRAFFEMNFDKPVFHFAYSIGMWSSSEQLNGSAILQVKDANGNWTTVQNLLSLDLKTKEQGFNRYNILSEPNPNNPIENGRRGFYGIRFETTATATGTKNKGRMCIDDLAFDIREPVKNADGTVAPTSVLNDFYCVFPN